MSHLPLNSNSIDKSTGETSAKVLSVEQLNRQIRMIIEGQLSVVWVQGEISNFKAHTSGHFYFSLKDKNSQIRAVMFRGHNSRLQFKPKDGLEILVRGKISVYEPRGDYQIVCEMMEPVGAGALQRAFEELKMKLKSEGLFEVSKKRKLPTHPKHLAIVTSPTGAAIQDMLNVLNRRNKTVRVTLVPTIVQGEGSAEKICEALEKAWRIPEVDVIIIGRGGGSIEDLWAFNNENLARLISKSPVPVISAVGHEIDFTIADFVADLRAPTPSAAAELVASSSEDLISKLTSFQRMLAISMQKILQNDKHRLRSASARLVDPKRKLQDLIQRNDELLQRVQNSMVRYFEKRHIHVHLAFEKIPKPEKIISRYRSRVELAHSKLKNIFMLGYENHRAQFFQLMSVLDSLSPLKVLERGYAVVRVGNKVVKNVNQVKIGNEINILVAQGEINAEIKSLKKGSQHGL